MADRNDARLWEIAKKRASFRGNLLSYVIVIPFLWAIWFFTGENRHNGFPWPVWAMLGWGIGLVFHYLGAYVWTSGGDPVEREYQKLKDKQKQ